MVPWREDPNDSSEQNEQNEQDLDFFIYFILLQTIKLSVNQIAQVLCQVGYENWLPLES